jgi:sec-independent protein translocase protein TatA
MGNIGISELLLLVFLVLLLFGARRIPDLGAAIGKALREFRKANNGESPDEKSASEKKDSEDTH